jgi:hypothetical protein
MISRAQQAWQARSNPLQQIRTIYAKCFSYTKLPKVFAPSPFFLWTQHVPHSLLSRSEWVGDLVDYGQGEGEVDLRQAAERRGHGLLLCHAQEPKKRARAPHPAQVRPCRGEQARTPPALRPRGPPPPPPPTRNVVQRHELMRHRYQPEFSSG